MDEIKRILEEDIVVEKVNLVRATMNEAHLIRDNLMQDLFDYKKIVVDLSECHYVDSTFFGAIVYVYKQLLREGGLIIIVMNDTFLKRTFIYRDFERIFKVCNTVREAVEEFNKLAEVLES